jgi:hypothetical protein
LGELRSESRASRGFESWIRSTNQIDAALPPGNEKPGQRGNQTQSQTSYLNSAKLQINQQEATLGGADLAADATNFPKLRPIPKSRSQPSSSSRRIIFLFIRNDEESKIRRNLEQLPLHPRDQKENHRDHDTDQDGTRQRKIKRGALAAVQNISRQTS